MATGTDLRPRPRSRRDPARREAILQTAATVFARSGYAATAMIFVGLLLWSVPSLEYLIHLFSR